MKRPYSSVGGLMVVGLSVGLALGVTNDNIPLYMSIGIALGLLFGFGIDMQRRKKQD